MPIVELTVTPVAIPLKRSTRMSTRLLVERQFLWWRCVTTTARVGSAIATPGQLAHASSRKLCRRY